MDRVFDELVGNIMEVYVDDMVVKSATSGDHPEHLRRVLQRIQDHNLRLNPENVSLRWEVANS